MGKELSGMMKEIVNALGTKRTNEKGTLKKEKWKRN
jgi:hypothetical protein